MSATQNNSPELHDKFQRVFDNLCKDVREEMLNVLKTIDEKVDATPEDIDHAMSHIKEGVAAMVHKAMADNKTHPGIFFAMFATVVSSLDHSVTVANDQARSANKDNAHVIH